MSLADHVRVCFHGAGVAIDPAALAHVEARREAMLAHARSDPTAYGINTGLGLFNRVPVSPPDEAEFQRLILCGRANGVGPPLSEPVVRGAMLLRLEGFLAGHAGVSAQLCERIAQLLGGGWHPHVPAAASGNAGEVTPLAHLFQTLVGEGLVRGGEGWVGAERGLEALGLRPLALGVKEGLALVNGAPLAVALAVPLALRAALLLEHATVAGALWVALCGASGRPYSRRVGELSGDRGRTLVCARMGALLDGGDALGPRLQAPVSLRVIPQVHGAAAGALWALLCALEVELRAVSDSPVFLDADPATGEPAGIYPTGNFHAASITLALEALGLAFAHVLNLLEKRLHRLMDSRFSTLPDQLSAQPGLRSGVTGLHKQVVGLCAQARALALPSSLAALDASTGQEDIEAHTLLVALRLSQLLDCLELALAYELVALRQAAALSPHRPPPPLAVALERIAALVEPALVDRSLAADVERVRRLVAGGGLLDGLPRAGGELVRGCPPVDPHLLALTCEGPRA
ncbi:MAG TPA: aromatic amino acid lyase [Solirubrobacteraceae bacterium]|nr:aromatic amino acid lyase [Solirubrobacteraceae bacterium]